MIGGAAGNGDDDCRVTGLQLASGFLEVGLGIVQQAGDSIGNLIDFLAHQGCHRFMSLINVSLWTHRQFGDEVVGITAVKR